MTYFDSLHCVHKCTEVFDDWFRQISSIRDSVLTASRTSRVKAIEKTYVRNRPLKPCTSFPSWSKSPADLLKCLQAWFDPVISLNCCHLACSLVILHISNVPVQIGHRLAPYQVLVLSLGRYSLMQYYAETELGLGFTTLDRVRVSPNLSFLFQTFQFWSKSVIFIPDFPVLHLCLVLGS